VSARRLLAWLRGVLADVPDMDGPLPECGCGDCQDERDLALWTREWAW
jgi:hypothetical protein